MNKVAKQYQRIFNEPMHPYKLYKVNRRVDSQAYIMLILLSVILVWALLAYSNVLDVPRLPWELLMVSITFLGIGPILYILILKRRKIILTEKALLKQNWLGTYKILPFDSFKETNHVTPNLTKISTGKYTINIKFAHYDADLENLKELINYLGFHKEKQSDYSISFENNAFMITEVPPVIDEDTSRLYIKQLKKYEYLTPGFFEDLLFHDTPIRKVALTEAQHLVFYLGHIDVKSSHPENTTETSHKSDEAMIIFEHIDSVNVKTFSEDEKLAKSVGLNIQALRDISKDALIVDSKAHKINGRYKIELMIRQNTKQYTTSFSFSQVIAGWNELVIPSWFE